VLFGQVQAFIEVARTGNVSRAAEALYVTQPALTARIQAPRGTFDVLPEEAAARAAVVLSGWLGPAWWR